MNLLNCIEKQNVAKKTKQCNKFPVPSVQILTNIFQQNLVFTEAHVSFNGGRVGIGTEQRHHLFLL